MRLLDRTVRARLCASGLSLLLFALVAAVLSLPRVEEPVSQASAPAEGLEAYRLDRDQLREQECSQLREMIDDPQTDSAIRARAQGRLLDLMKWAEIEADLEEVLQARGFEAVLVSVHQDCANVLVRTDALSQADAALILELTARASGLTGGAIKVIPAGSARTH